MLWHDSQFGGHEKNTMTPIWNAMEWLEVGQLTKETTLSVKVFICMVYWGFWGELSTVCNVIVLQT